MADTKLINLKNTAQKWVELMTYMHEDPSAAFEVICADEASATKVVKGLRSVVDRHPNWCRMKVIQRTNCVYIIKSLYTQKVRVIQ
jgi:hypothetical protein